MVTVTGCQVMPIRIRLSPKSEKVIICDLNQLYIFRYLDGLCIFPRISILGMYMYIYIYISDLIRSGESE